MTIFLIKPECAKETDDRILEVEHSSLIIKRGEYDDDGTKKFSYTISDHADPYAVKYVFWGDATAKEEFEKRKRSGKFKFPGKRACPLCKTTQT
ncbi:MAG: hypothetical protein WCQ96_05095 [Patescibacteria group bacterium]